MKPKAAPLSTPQVERLLRARYPKTSHALLFGVPNDAGFNKSRTIDALAMGLWPSRGLTLEGFEIKVSRSDWLREMREPEKADAIACYCDRFWLVVGDRAIVHPGELPPAWGLLAPRGDGLVAVEEAKPLTPRPIDRGFLAALLKKSVEQSVDAEALAAAQKAGADEGRRLAGYEAQRIQREHEALVKTVREFERASGVRLEHAWEGGARIGDAVRIVLAGEHRSEEQRMRRMRETAASIVKQIDATMDGAS